MILSKVGESLPLTGKELNRKQPRFTGIENYGTAVGLTFHDGASVSLDN